MILLFSIKKWKFKVKLKTFNADGSKRKSETVIFMQRTKWLESLHQIGIIIITRIDHLL